MRILKLLSIATLAFASGALVGCNSSKSLAVEEGVAIRLEPCIQLQQLEPERRAWGEGTDYTIADATDHAKASARASFSFMLESAVEAGTSHWSKTYAKAGGEGENGGLKSETVSLDENFYSAVTRQILRNTAVIKTTVYKQKDGRYHVFVCIEYRGAVEEMAESIAREAEEQLSDEEKIRTRFDHQLYKREIEEQIKNITQN